MRRIVACLALALSLLGCYGGGASALPGESVPLLTGALTCYAGGEGGPTALLVVDPKYGTSLNGQPVMWPKGYTARRAGSEVDVLDTQGKVIATTGRTYHISRAYAPELFPNDDGSFDGTPPPSAFPAAADCTYHHDFIDCTANPTDMWCQPREPLPHELPGGPSPTPPQPKP
jgi:hypothetical protein